MGTMGQQILVCEPQISDYFNRLELKKGHFWSVLGLRPMVLTKTSSLGRKGTLLIKTFD